MQRFSNSRNHNYKIKSELFVNMKKIDYVVTKLLNHNR